MNPYDTIGNYGLIDKDPSHKVRGMIEKPKTEEELKAALGETNSNVLRQVRKPVSTGAYLLNIPRLLSLASQDWVKEMRAGKCDMGGNFIPGLIENGEGVYSYTVDDWADFGGTQLILDSSQRVLRGEFPTLNTHLEAHPYYVNLGENVWVHVDTLRIKNDRTNLTLEQMIGQGIVKIGPNTFLGRNVNVEPEAVIAYSDIQKNSHVGEGARVVRSYLMPAVRIEDVATVEGVGIGMDATIHSSRTNPSRINGRSIIGPDIHVPEGTILDGVTIWPGYEFKGTQKVYSQKDLMPTQKRMLELFKELYPKK